MKNRITLKSKITRARAEELTGEIATLTLERNERKIAMDRELTAIRENYEGTIDPLEKQIAEKTELLEAWASANPDEFPKDRKSLDMLHAVIGYRTGTPKLKTLLRFTWPKVLERIINSNHREWRRIKETVNKDQIIEDFAQKIVGNAELKGIGVEVVQDEIFFIEPKLEQLENRTTKETK